MNARWSVIGWNPETAMVRFWSTVVHFAILVDARNSRPVRGTWLFDEMFLIVASGWCFEPHPNSSRERRPACRSSRAARVAALKSRLRMVLVWLFDVWGTADLLYAAYDQGNLVGLEPDQLGAGDFIITVFVPLLLITHGLMFWLLLPGGMGTAEQPNGHPTRPPT